MTRRSGVSYSDLTVICLALLCVVGQSQMRGLAGWVAWIPPASLLLWLAARWTGIAGSPWPFALSSIGLLFGVGVVYWHHGVSAFMVVVTVASLLEVVGLALRTRYVFARLSRIDVFSVMAALFSVALTIGLLEATLRLLPGVFGQEVRQSMVADVRNYGVAHPYIGHLHRPNGVFELAGRDFRVVNHVDALGFRNPGPPVQQADVVAVGDSLTFGYGVDDDQSWPALLGKALAPATVVNLGLIGAGPEQYRRVYETFGSALRPKVLVVGLFAQNDLWDAGMFDIWEREGAEPNYMVWRDFGRATRVRFSLRDPIGGVKRLVRATGYRALRQSSLFKLLGALRQSEAGALPQEYTLADGSLMRLFPDDYLARRDLARPGQREFDLAVAALERLHMQTAKEGTRMIVALQPGKEDVYLPLMGVTSEDFTAALRPALEARGIEYLDLGPAFRQQAAGGTRLFFDVDGHPNRDGYALTARTVATYLNQNAARLGLSASRGVHETGKR